MSDLIDRNDAVEAIEFEKVYMTAYKGSSNGYVSDGNLFEKYNKGLDDAIKAINGLTSVKPEPKWIPCSERLPDWNEHKNEMVLVCYGNGSIRFDTYMHDDWVHGNPIAWMQLPEPWRGE